MPDEPPADDYGQTMSDLPARRSPAPPAAGDDYGQTLAGDARPGGKSGFGGSGQGGSGYGFGPSAFGSGFDGADTGLKFIRELARGGMGVVNLVRGGPFNKHFAVKRMLAEFADSEAALDRFMTEAKAAGSLNSPHLITVHEVGEDEQGPMIRMDYVPGPVPAAPDSDWGPELPNPPMNLEQYVKQFGPLSVAEALRVIEQVAWGIETAHKAGIVHRDIKPANILLGERLVPKLGDFGLARRHEGEDPEDGRTIPGTPLLTPGYGAPEQHEDATRADHRADIYALGATLLFATTGRQPRYVRDADAPEAIRPLISKALTHDVTRRHQSVAEFLHDLTAARARAGGGDSLALPAPAAHVPPGTIAKGVCYACGHQHGGDADALTFCNECGESVRTPCLTCGNFANPIWAKRCGGCGADVQAAVKTKADGFAKTREGIDGLLAEYAIDQVKSQTGDILATTDPRFGDDRKWATQQREGPIKDREAEVRTLLQKVVKEAELLKQMQNYAEARRVLTDGLPGPLRERLATPTIARHGGKQVSTLLAEIQETERQIDEWAGAVRRQVDNDKATPFDFAAAMGGEKPSADKALPTKGTPPPPPRTNNESSYLYANQLLDRIQAVRADHPELKTWRTYFARRRGEVEQMAFDEARRAHRPETAKAFLKIYDGAPTFDLPETQVRQRAEHVEQMKRHYLVRLRATAFARGGHEPAIQAEYLEHRTAAQKAEDVSRAAGILFGVTLIHILVLVPLAAAALGGAVGLAWAAGIGGLLGFVAACFKMESK